MSTKSREVIFGSRIRGAKIHADGARERAKQAVRETDRAEAEALSIRMEGYGGPAQPSPTIGECLNGACRDTLTMSAHGGIVLQKSFWGDERKFSGPPMRFASGDVRDHIVS